MVSIVAVLVRKQAKRSNPAGMRQLPDAGGSPLVGNSHDAGSLAQAMFCEEFCRPVRKLKRVNTDPANRATTTMVRPTKPRPGTGCASTQASANDVTRAM